MSASIRSTMQLIRDPLAHDLDRYVPTPLTEKVIARRLANGEDGDGNISGLGYLAARDARKYTGIAAPSAPRRIG